MISEPVIFDSRNNFFKNPTGAVTSDREIEFRIGLARELDPGSVRLVILYDRHDTPAVYELARCEDPAASWDNAFAPHSDPAKCECSDPDNYDLYTTNLKIHDTGLYWYHFEIKTADGTLRAGKGNGGRAIIDESSGTWQQTVYKKIYDDPQWLWGGIFYHVFVDRFHPSGRDRLEQEGKFLRPDWGGRPKWQPEEGKVLNNDFFGGDLEGIRQKLPYLASLNVTCLYLSPIFEAYSNHKYDTGNYEVIDPMFGSEEDFIRLCSDAEKYGMKVICDGVFAHTGSDSVYFDRYGHYRDRGYTPAGAYLDPGSPYRSWYHFHDDGTYDCWWDFDTLPKLDKREPSYVDYITGENGIVRKWLRAGAHGWRLDVADELPCDFLDRLVAAAKAEKTDALVVGEVWEDASNKIAYDERKNYFEGARLDSVMNYPFRTAIIEFVRKGNAGFIRETVETIMEHYPLHVVHSLMNLLGTHDSPRIITSIAGEDLGQDPPREMQANTRLDETGWQKGIEMLKRAVLLQMTLPGVPCIYYGDEAGTEGYKDPFNRTCFPWGSENQEILDWYRKITSIRSSRKVYREGSYRTMRASDGLYAFQRYDDNNSIITVVNCGDMVQVLDLIEKNRDLLTGDLFENEITVGPGQMLLLERVDPTE